MITIVLGWWALLTSVTVSAETEARGATLDFARVESQYRCSKVLADLCAARELGPPVRVDTGAAQCGRETSSPDWISTPWGTLLAGHNQSGSESAHRRVANRSPLPNEIDERTQPLRILTQPTQRLGEDEPHVALGALVELGDHVHWHCRASTASGIERVASAVEDTTHRHLAGDVVATSAPDTGPPTPIAAVVDPAIPLALEVRAGPHGRTLGAVRRHPLVGERLPSPRQHTQLRQPPRLAWWYRDRWLKNASASSLCSRHSYCSLEATHTRRSAHSTATAIERARTRRLRSRSTHLPSCSISDGPTHHSLSAPPNDALVTRRTPCVEPPMSSEKLAGNAAPQVTTQRLPRPAGEQRHLVLEREDPLDELRDGLVGQLEPALIHARHVVIPCDVRRIRDGTDGRPQVFGNPSAARSSSGAMYTNPYAVRHFLLALTIAAGDELAADIELLVEWPPWIEGAARA